MGIFSRHKKQPDQTPKDANFYIYFAKEHKADGQKAEKLFKKQGYKTDFHWLEYDGGAQWSLTLNKQAADLDEVLALEKDIEPIAKAHQGEYDGHEIEV